MTPSEFSDLAQGATFVVAVILLLLQLGRRSAKWDGAWRHQRTDDPKPNGSPTIGELDRRVKALETNQVGVQRCNDRHDAIRTEINELHAIDTAQTRRIDSLMGTP